MKRKIMSALLIASMVVGLAACGDTGNNGGTATGDNNASAGAEASSSGGQTYRV